MILAAIFEFLGAVTLGSQVSKTIRGGIAELGCFTDNPGLLMYGMTCVILAVAIWLLVASYSRRANIFMDESRGHRRRDVDSPRRRVAAPPRPRRG